MKRWRVNVTVEQYAYTEVFAETQEEAEDAVYYGQYEDLYGVESGDLHVENSYEIDENGDEVESD